MIDAEVRDLIDQAARQAREILTGKRNILDEIAKHLQEKEVVSGEEIKKLIHGNA